MEANLLVDSDIKSNASFAQQASAAGFDTVFIGELWGPDAFVQLTNIANKTEDINLGTGIINVFSRTPAVIAMASYALTQITDDQFTLGVGVSTPTAIENTHGLSYERPIRRAHEVIELVQRLHADDNTVSYDGELVSVTNIPPLTANVPIYNAALGEANRRVTGRLCDGWIPHMIPFTHLEDAFETIATHANKNDRDPDDITVAPWVPTAVDDDPEQARITIRRHIAYYTGSSHGYNQAVGKMFPNQAATIYEAWQQGKRDLARQNVTDDMISELGVAGTPEMARKQLREVTSTCKIDCPTIIIPSGSDHSLINRTIDEIGELL